MREEKGVAFRTQILSRRSATLSRSFRACSRLLRSVLPEVDPVAPPQRTASARGAHAARIRDSGSRPRVSERLMIRFADGDERRWRRNGRTGGERGRRKNRVSYVVSWLIWTAQV